MAVLVFLFHTLLTAMEPVIQTRAHYSRGLVYVAG